MAWYPCRAAQRQAASINACRRSLRTSSEIFGMVVPPSDRSRRMRAGAATRLYVAWNALARCGRRAGDDWGGTRLVRLQGPLWASAPDVPQHDVERLERRSYGGHGDAAHSGAGPDAAGAGSDRSVRLLRPH